MHDKKNRDVNFSLVINFSKLAIDCQVLILWNILEHLLWNSFTRQIYQWILPFVFVAFREWLTISSSLLAASISSCGLPLGSFLLSCIRDVCCLIRLSNSLILACLQSSVSYYLLSKSNVLYEDAVMKYLLNKRTCH